MRRRTVHAMFALSALAAGGVFVSQLVALDRAASVNRALASVLAASSIGTGPTDTVAGISADDAPRVRLARASAFAARGDVEAAERIFARLAREHTDSALGDAARLGLANRYLREGMRDEIDPRRAAPLLELAKQRYRDLLRERPDDWDARYNLERALRLAPESADAATSDAGDPIKRVNVIVPGFAPKDLP